MRNRSVQLAAAVALALASTIAAAQVPGAGTTRATPAAGTPSTTTTAGATSGDTSTGTTATTAGGCRPTGGSTCVVGDSNTPSTAGGTTPSSSASDFSPRAPAPSSGGTASGSSGASGSAPGTNQATTDVNTSTPANTGTIATPGTTGVVGVLPGDTGLFLGPAPNGERVVNSNTVVTQPPSVTVLTTPLLDATTKEAHAREQRRRSSGKEPRVIGIAPRTDADLTHQMPDDRIIRY